MKVTKYNNPPREDVEMGPHKLVCTSSSANFDLCLLKGKYPFLFFPRAHPLQMLM